MKISIILLFILSSMTLIRSEEKGTLRLKLASVVGNKSSLDIDQNGNFGLKSRSGANISIQYMSSIRLGLLAGYNRFSKSQQNVNNIDFSIQLSQVDLEFLYYFLAKEGLIFKPYLVAGLGIVSVKTGRTNVNTSSLEEEKEPSKSGINIGLGVDLILSERLGAYVQAKHNTVDISEEGGQWLVNIGISFDVIQNKK